MRNFLYFKHVGTDQLSPSCTLIIPSRRFSGLNRSPECSRTSCASIRRFVSSSIPTMDPLAWILRHFSLSSPEFAVLSPDILLSFSCRQRVWSSWANISRLAQSAGSFHRDLIEWLALFPWSFKCLGDTGAYVRSRLRNIYWELDLTGADFPDPLDPRLILRSDPYLE